MKLNRKQKGFTLIELIVVIAIIGILAAVALPAITGQTGKARIAAADGAAGAIDSALAVALADGTLSAKPVCSAITVGTYLEGSIAAKISIASGATKVTYTDGSNTATSSVSLTNCTAS